MSTFKDIIARVDEIRPNSFPQSAKLRWLTELDGRIAIDVFMLNIEETRALPQGDEALECEPLVGFPHESIYDAWLEAMIHFSNGEVKEYQNALEMYNSKYSNFTLWFAQEYDPVQGYEGGSEHV